MACHCCQNGCVDRPWCRPLLAGNLVMRAVHRRLCPGRFRAAISLLRDTEAQRDPPSPAPGSAALRHGAGELRGCLHSASSEEVGGPESRSAGSVLGPGARGTACSASEASEPGTPRHPCVPVPLVAPGSSPGCEVSELCQTRDWPQVGGPYAPSGQVWGSHGRCPVPNTDSWFLAQASASWTGKVGYIELLERKAGRGHQPVPSTRAL